MRIRTLIVDDESVIRQQLLSLLSTDSDFDVVGECANGAAAVRAIGVHKPDLLFLDVQMPEMTGFEVLQAISPAPLPATIFVTSYDPGALRAFESHSLDYLLKPVATDRFTDTVVRAKNAFRTNKAVSHGLAELVREMQKTRRSMMVRTGGRVVFIRLDDIELIEAAANYVKIHTADQQYVVREKISNIEQHLPPASFVRIHRSLIVGIDRVRELESCGNGEFVVILQGGRELPLGRTYRTHVESALRGPQALAQKVS